MAEGAERFRGLWEDEMFARQDLTALFREESRLPPRMAELIRTPPVSPRPQPRLSFVLVVKIHSFTSSFFLSLTLLKSTCHDSCYSPITCNLSPAKGMGLSFLDEEIHNEIFWLVLSTQRRRSGHRQRQRQS